VVPSLAGRNGQIQRERHQFIVLVGHLDIVPRIEADGGAGSRCRCDCRGAASWRSSSHTGRFGRSGALGKVLSVNILRRRAVRIGLDLCLLLGFIAEFITREGPDYDVHSWIGVVLIPLIGIHLSSNWRWVTSTYRRRQAHPDWPLARFNAAFTVVTTVCILSGFPIWLGWSDSSVWSTLHNVTGFVSVVLALSHLWRNRRRLVTLVRRQGSAPSGRV